jgi:hypothetical protein
LRAAAVAASCAVRPYSTNVIIGAVLGLAVLMVLALRSCVTKHIPW